MVVKPLRQSAEVQQKHFVGNLKILLLLFPFFFLGGGGGRFPTPFFLFFVFFYFFFFSFFFGGGGGVIWGKICVPLPAQTLSLPPPIGLLQGQQRNTHSPATELGAVGWCWRWGQLSSWRNVSDCKDGSGMKFEWGETCGRAAQSHDRNKQT